MSTKKEKAQKKVQSVIKSKYSDFDQLRKQLSNTENLTRTSIILDSIMLKDYYSFEELLKKVQSHKKVDCTKHFKRVSDIRKHIQFRAARSYVFDIRYDIDNNGQDCVERIKLVDYIAEAKNTDRSLAY